MKIKNTICILALIALLTVLPSLAMASDAEGEIETHVDGDYEYVLQDDGTAMITKYSGRASALAIPDTLSERSVTAIGESAFSDCASISSVTIPDSVTLIGRNPFAGCESLVEIQVAANHGTLEVIDQVLINKSERKLICYPAGLPGAEYEIPQGIRGIGEYAFYSCANLKKVTFHEGVSSIWRGAFSLSSVEEITIPKSVVYIGDDAFASCAALKSVTISTDNKMTSVSDGVFASCTSLASISLPSTVTAIGEGSFSRCSALETLEIPDAVKSIGETAFDECENLTLKVGRGSEAAACVEALNLEYSFSH